MTEIVLSDPTDRPADRGRRRGRTTSAVDRVDRTPPHDEASEQAVLGAMLLSGQAVAEVVELLRAEDFYLPVHAAVFSALVDLFDQGVPHDPIAVEHELRRRGDAERIERVSPSAGYFLHGLTEASRTADPAYCAEVVAELAVTRRVAEAGTRIAQLGHSAAAGADVGELTQRAQAELDAALTERSSGPAYTSPATMRADALSWLDDLQAGRIPPGLPTGFLDLDELTGGFKGGQMIVVAARPGAGKSTLGMDVMRAVSVPRDATESPLLTRSGREPVTSVMFSLEMSQRELWLRLLSAESRVRYKLMETPGALRPEDYDKIHRAHDRLDRAPLFLDGSPTITPSQIRARAKQIKARHGLGLIVVDYLQLMTSGKRVESRQQEVSEFSRNLKLVAKELDVPVIAISQLNRGPEQRKDGRPMLSDLRESGALEQDADMVILIHRPEMYDPDDARAGEADLIVAKHRGGPTATVTVAQQLHIGRFADLARAHA